MGVLLRYRRLVRAHIAMLMAFAVLATSIHCALHAAAAISSTPSVSPTSADGTPPREAPAPCEHESGCLCRGAVLAKSVEAPSLCEAGEWTHKLALEASPQFSIATATRGVPVRWKRGLDELPPISGRKLRAWVNSLQC